MYTLLWVATASLKHSDDLRTVIALKMVRMVFRQRLILDSHLEDCCRLDMGNCHFGGRHYKFHAENE